MTETCREILLVEDDPSDLKLAVRALSDQLQGCQVHVARDGVEALDFMYRRGAWTERSGDDPGLILLDLKLPLMDGHQVLQQLKSDPEFRNIPVVLMTSSTVDDDVQKGYELGVNSYVVKPVDFETYTTVVRQLGQYWLRVNLLPAR